MISYFDDFLLGKFVVGEEAVGVFFVLVPGDFSVAVLVIFFPLPFRIVIDVFGLDVVNPNGEFFFRHFAVAVLVHFVNEQTEFFLRLLGRQIVKRFVLVLASKRCLNGFYNVRKLVV